jgi:hypothetical protein
VRDEQVSANVLLLSRERRSGALGASAILDLSFNAPGEIDAILRLHERADEHTQSDGRKRCAHDLNVLFRPRSGHSVRVDGLTPGAEQRARAI